jgi:hypothetical protein
MLYREIIAVCSQIYTKHINTLFRQNVELLNVKPGGTYSNHWALKGWMSSLKIRSQYTRRLAVPPTVFGKIPMTPKSKGFCHWRFPCCIYRKFWWAWEEIQFSETPPQHDVAPIDDETGASNDVTHNWCPWRYAWRNTASGVQRAPINGRTGWRRNRDSQAAGLG